MPGGIVTWQVHSKGKEKLWPPCNKVGESHWQVMPNGAYNVERRKPDTENRAE